MKIKWFVKEYVYVIKHLKPVGHGRYGKQDNHIENNPIHNIKNLKIIIKAGMLFHTIR
jgi:hypothetical protein